MLLAARLVTFAAIVAQTPAPADAPATPPPARSRLSPSDDLSKPEELSKPFDIETRSEESDTSALIGQFVKTMVALGLVIGLIYLLAKVGVARFIPGGVAARSGKTVRVVERVAVDQKNSLVLVEVGAERLLLGSGDQGLRLITHVGADGAPSFKAVLDKGRVETGTTNDAT